MMNKFWKGLAVFIVATVFIAAGFKAVDDQYLLWKNIVPNPGFENGQGSWTTSGGSLTTTTTASEVGSGSVALQFDPSATSQVAENADIAIPAGLFGEACALFVRYKGGGTADITIEANNGSTLGTAITVSSAASNYTLARSQFTCPTSGNLHVEMTSAGDAAALYVDDFWIGRDIIETFASGGSETFSTINGASAHFFTINFHWSSGTPQTLSGGDPDNMVSSYSDDNTGSTTISLNAGCSAKPFCTCNGDSGAVDCSYLYTNAASSSTALKVIATDTSASQIDLTTSAILNCRCAQ